MMKRISLLLYLYLKEKNVETTIEEVEYNLYTALQISLLGILLAYVTVLFFLL